MTSPTLLAQLDALRFQFPNVRVHRYDPVSLDNARAGAALVFGAGREPVYHFDRADVVLSLDADFLASSTARGAVRARFS